MPGPLLAVTNAPHSTLARRADAILDCRAGPEVGVAATKTFTAQVLVGSTFGLALAAACGADVIGHVAALARVPNQLRMADDIAEITARGARLIRIGADGASTFPVLGGVNGAPWGPLPAVLPLQHLARRLARALGRDPDRPRNLAKSVTVE